MRALTWQGKEAVRVADVPDPKILNDRDAIIEVTSCAICGSDLHLYDGFMPVMEPGDILGHEAMGRVVEVGNRSDLRHHPSRRARGRAGTLSQVPRQGGQLHQGRPAPLKAAGNARKGRPLGRCDRACAATNRRNRKSADGPGRLERSSGR
jgi:hypothetical protein